MSAKFFIRYFTLCFYDFGVLCPIFTARIDDDRGIFSNHFIVEPVVIGGQHHRIEGGQGIRR